MKGVEEYRAIIRHIFEGRGVPESPLVNSIVDTMASAFAEQDRILDAMFPPSTTFTIKLGPVTCKRCNLPNPDADPNQADGSYVCYNCR